MTPEQLNATAQSLAEGKSYVSAHAASRAWALRVKRAVLHGHFDQLDALCQAIESRRATNPELSAARAMLDLATARYPYQNVNWSSLQLATLAREGEVRSSWARALAVMAGSDHARMAALSTEQGIFRRADWEGYRLLKELWELPDGHPAAPAVRLYNRWSIHHGYDLKKDNLAVLSRFPQDAGLLTAVGRVENRLDPFCNWSRRDYTRAAAAYQEAPAPAAALYLTINDSLLPGHALELYGYRWETLKPQFESLIQAHPDDAELHRSFARWASDAGDQKVASQELARLGWQADAVLWGDTSSPELKQLTSSASALPALTVGAEGSNLALDLAPQVIELIGLEKFELLDALAQQLRRSHPELLSELYAATEKVPLKRLQAWRDHRPGNHTAEVAVAQGLVRAAWNARGDGYASEVSAAGWVEFRAKIKVATDLARQAASARLGDAKLFELLITLEMAGDGDAERAFRIASESARQSLRRDLALGAFALLILPRWHGQPGDLVRYADRLRQALGHDQAYAKLAATVRAFEGDQSFKPEAEVPLDWKRWKASYAANRAAGNLSLYDKHHYMLACMDLGDRSECSRVLDDLGDDWDEDTCSSAGEMRVNRLWAEGKVKDFMGRPSSRLVNPGYCQPEDPRVLTPWLDASGVPGEGWPSGEVRPAFPVRPIQPRWTAGSRVPALPGVEFGFDLRFAQPLPETLHLNLEVQGPELNDPQKKPWSHFVWRQLVDAGQQTVPIRMSLSERFMAEPALWTVRVVNHDDGIEIARHTFQVIAP